MVARLASVSNSKLESDATSLELPSDLDRSEGDSIQRHNPDCDTREDGSRADKDTVTENNTV